MQDSAEAGTKGEVAALLAALLRQKAELLDECFALRVDAGEGGGALRTMPRVVRQR